MNDELYKRFRKLRQEPIECLFAMRDEKQGDFHFLINGSSGTRYKVSIQRQTGRVACSCPDYKYNNRVQECICKHALFVVAGILHNKIDHAFFKRGYYFTADEMPLVKTYLKDQQHNK